MAPPLGLFRPPHYICCLKCAFYGVKQAPRAQFKQFNTCVLNKCLEQSAHDSSEFTMHTRVGSVFPLLYVDDMITGSNIDGVHYLKNFLQKQFEMKDLGFLHYFLGSVVAYSPISFRKKILVMMSFRGWPIRCQICFFFSFSKVTLLITENYTV